jgi:hypothetical protein
LLLIADLIAKFDTRLLRAARQGQPNLIGELSQKEAKREGNNQRQMVHGRPCPREGFLRLFFGGFLVFFLAM